MALREPNDAAPTPEVRNAGDVVQAQVNLIQAVMSGVPADILAARVAMRRALLSFRWRAYCPEDRW